MNIQEIKKDIYELIQLGDLTDNSFKKLFINKHSIIGKECELWDFKENFDGTKEAYLKLLKAIASFYNSYGGYIFYGVKEVIKDTSMKVIGVNQNIIDNQKLRGQFDKFFGRRIDLTYFEIKHDVDDTKLNVGILHIPKRGVQDSPLTPISDGVGSGNERILSKDFIFIRRDDQCKSAVSLDDFKFVSGERVPTYVVIQTIVRKK
ncbi:ATP-binding protein [Enterobacter ludwigii]|nr:ATP-binding protein [Enterobacter ludwigii]